MARPAALLAVACLLALGLLAAGCGSDATGDGQGEYAALLEGLDKAAHAGETFEAAKKARALKPIEKEMVHSFCLLNWQGKVNREVGKYKQHAYVVSRIRNFAAYEPEEQFAPSTNAALRELRSIIDLTELDPELVRAYSKACYR